ncbi:MAG: hypothetical protein U1E65_14110 [Myxococcota bacterium]
MSPPPRLWILADAHAGAIAEADASLLRLIDRATALGVDLLVLGDLFLAWLGLPRFQTAFQQDVLRRFRAHRASGRRVDFVVGNRDYLVAEGERGQSFDDVFEEAVRPIGGVPTLVVHGDQLNPADHGYRAWHAISRSQPVSRLLSHIPSRWAAGRAEAIERRLRRHGRAYKTGDLPMEALYALGRRAAQLGAKQALCGHFHHDRLLDVPGGVPVIIAPAWLDQRRILEVDGDGGLRSIDPF